MRRRSIALLAVALVAAACSGDAEPTTTTTSSTNTTTTTSTTTTTIPTTTTTEYRLEIEGAGAELMGLVSHLYSGRAEPGSLPAPDDLIEAFSRAEGDLPTEAVASVANWDEQTELATVVAGSDVTLAVADPDWRIVGGWWPARGVEAHLGEFPKILAVVGSDARPGENRETARADSIHFVGIDGNGEAGIVGVPRDSWVPIPGAGNSKINASLAFGGPEMMMDTFTELTDLDFDGYLLTGFAGFQEMIEVLGGLAMDVPRNFNDRAAKAYLSAGEQVLNAAEVLALSRTRKTLPRGDFQRQEHGGLVMMAAQSMVRAGGAYGLPELLAGVQPHLSTDLDPAGLLVTAAAITRVEPGRVTNVVAPGGVGSAGGASVVFLRDSASELWDDLADGSLETE